VLLVLNGPTMIVSLKRIYPGFQKYLDWFFCEKKSVGSFFGRGWLMPRN
jgi:hypothetical protein